MKKMLLLFLLLGAVTQQTNTTFDNKRIALRVGAAVLFALVVALPSKIEPKKTRVRGDHYEKPNMPGPEKSELGGFDMETSTYENHLLFARVSLGCAGVGLLTYDFFTRNN